MAVKESQGKNKKPLLPARATAVFHVLLHVSPLLADAGGFASQLAQVKQARAAHFAFAEMVDFFDIRRVQREDALHADAVRNFAHRKGFTDAVATPL